MTKNVALPSALTASDARTNFYDLAEQVSEFSRRFTVTLRGKPAVVIMSLDELESIEETLEIMSDPELVESIRRGEEDRKAGRVYTLEEVLKDLKLNESRVHQRGKKTTGKVTTTGSKENYQKNSNFGNFCYGG